LFELTIASIGLEAFRAMRTSSNNKAMPQGPGAWPCHISPFAHHACVPSIVIIAENQIKFNKRFKSKVKAPRKYFNAST
jgi:hypothetical protein